MLGGQGFFAPVDELANVTIGVGRGHISYCGNRLISIYDLDINHFEWKII